MFPDAFLCKPDYIAYWISRLGVAIRFGEALNPGPDRDDVDTISFCITNPTSLAYKSDTYLELMKKHKCQVVSCSETSATITAQRHFASAMKKEKLRTTWSPPVQPLRATITGQLDGPGQSSGVAMISQLPIRKARLTLPEEWATSTRFLHNVIQVGESHVQVIVIYCRPVSNHHATVFNQNLLEMALSQAKLVPLPLMILGDFNSAPDSLPCWPQLQAEGFQHLAALHEKLFSVPMKPTCKNVTIPDTAILCPMLAKLVIDIEVLSSEWFATHRPVVFRLKIPQGRLFNTRIRFPRSFVELGLNEDEIRDAADEICPHVTPQTLEEWGAVVEQVFDRAIAKHHPQLANLPAAFRGRCKPGGIVKCPINSPVKKASDGDFEPRVEVLTMKTRRKIKQLRRLDSFFHRMNKYEKQGAHTPQTFVELQQEWSTIRKCTALGIPFLHWTQDLPALDYPTWPLPSAAWVNDVRQHLKHDVEQALHLDVKLLKQKNLYFKMLDKRNHNKQAYSQVRGPGNPPITEIGSCVNFPVLVVRMELPGQYEIYAEPTDIQSLKFDTPLAVGSFGAKLLDRQTHHAVVHVHDTNAQLEEQEQVVQNQFEIDPIKIVDQLNQYWQPIWQRDAHDLTFVDCDDIPPDIRQILDTVPSLPPMHVDMSNVQLWKDAISKLKTHSARGCDKISAQELKMLPTSLVKLLADTMTKYSRGFPQDFMIGLTAPLAKTADIPMRHQTRPITILPQLYRLWSMVACKQIAAHFSKHVTHDVTGLLSQRGSADTAYSFQFQLESAKCHNQPRSGLTLDLIKCFNNVRWQFGYILLKHLGVPPSLMTQWMLSIGCMNRMWLLQGELFSAGECSTGFPEGDSWSVLIMISITNAWCHYVRNQWPRDDLFLSGYADNWAWFLPESQGHQQILTATLFLTAAAGLTLDWNKTWFWCTHASDVENVKTQLAAIQHGHLIQQKQSASDLGHQLQYSGAYKKGVVSDRFAKGIRRLLRLKHMSHSLDVKEALLRTSIFPAAFYGCTIKPPAYDDIENFRSLAARALLGDGHTLNPAIVLLCTHGGILDPEVWITLQVIRAARNFLLKSTHETQQQFLRMASRFQGNLSQVKGPAAALAFCLRKLSWQIDQHGAIGVTAFLKFNLLHCSFKRFVRFVTIAWQDKLVMLHSQRSRWYNMPDICQYETVHALSRFPSRQRAALLRELAGCFQLANQKAKWIPDQTNICTYCEAVDTREHRLLHCPIGNEVRSHYMPLLHSLEEHGALIAEYPFATVHPLLEAQQMIFFNTPSPEWGHSLCMHVQDMVAKDIQVHWLTDGSCFHPASPLSRFSAYAVVLDLCETDDERCHFSRQFATLGDMPPCFQTAVVARTQGEQDILRAEMKAVESIMVTFGYGVIHTDSQTTITLMNLALNAESPWEFAHCEHMDILYNVWLKRDAIHNNLVKVKAHVLPADVTDDLQRYWTIGNAMVNDVAKSACQHLQPALVTQMEELHDDIMKTRNMLHAAYSLHLDLQKVRAIADNEQYGNSAKVQHGHDNLVAAFSAWTVTPFRCAAINHDVKFLPHSSFGLELATATLQWYRQLRWPLEDGGEIPGPLGFTTGISWIEMGLSWMMFHQMFVPIIREDSRGVKKLIQPINWEEACDCNLTLSEAGTMLQKMIDNVAALLPEPLLFSYPRGKVSSLYHQGAKTHVQGLRVRPQVPKQSQISEELQRVFQNSASPLQVTPRIQTTMESRRIFSGTWIFRQDQAKLRMKTVRQCRTRVG